MTHQDDLAVAIAPLWNERNTFERSSDAVYLTLREAILSKILIPGRVFTEEDLARAFGLSRTPVREAVLRLIGDHLLDRRGGRRLAVSSISPAEVLEIYDVRGALDALAARLATIHATPPEVAQLRWLNQKLEEAVTSGDAVEAFRNNLAFHDYLATMSKNTFLLQQIRVVEDRVRRFMHTTFELADRPANIVVEHQRILQAIEDGDADAAAAAASHHIMQSKDIRLAMIDEEARQPPAPPAAEADPADS